MDLDLTELKKVKSLAVFGGTFDPIHRGHLDTAEAVKEILGIDKVVFMPAGKPPHKNSPILGAPRHRYSMAVLAAMYNKDFDVSAYEINKTGKSYTIDTMKEIKKLCPKGIPLYFVTGADAFMSIRSWKKPKELVNMCHFIVVTRPGCNLHNLYEHNIRINEEYDTVVTVLEVPTADVSSTQIRRLLRRGESIESLVPPIVEDYIAKYDLYGKDNYYSSIHQYLKEHLTSNKYRHTLGVADTAVKLATHYGEDEINAYTAGLLHDIAKNIPDFEKEQMCIRYRVKTDEVMLNNPEILHSFLGAEIAIRVFAVTDREILDAIRYHTTGRKNMSRLEEIVFLADTIEPNRKEWSGLEDVRLAAFTDIDKAMFLALKSKIRHTTAKKQEPHPLSLAAFNYYKYK